MYRPIERVVNRTVPDIAVSNLADHMKVDGVSSEAVCLPSLANLYVLNPSSK